MIDLSKETLNMKELTEYLKIDRMTVTRWVRSNPKFPKPSKAGRKNLWKKSEIDEYLESTRK
jgi:excisionase family DNA binding protein